MITLSDNVSFSLINSLSKEIKKISSDLYPQNRPIPAFLTIIISIYDHFSLRVYP